MAGKSKSENIKKKGAPATARTTQQLSNEEGCLSGRDYSYCTAGTLAKVRTSETACRDANCMDVYSSRDARHRSKSGARVK